MNIRRISGALLLTGSIALTACGGGSGTSSTLPPVSPSTSPTTQNIGAFEFSVPRGGQLYTASGSRKVAYISASTATLNVKLSYSFPYSSTATEAYSHTFTIASDCPVPAGTTRAICTVGLTSLAPRPSAYANKPISAVATAYDNHGVVVSEVLGQSNCQDAFNGFTAGLQLCSIPLSGIVSMEAISQAKPLIAGTVGNIALTPTFVDPDNLVIADDAPGSLNTCLLTANGDQFRQGVALSDPHIGLSVNHPYLNLKLGAPIASCANGGQTVSNTPLPSPTPSNYVGVNTLLSPSDTVTLAYDGTPETAKPITVSTVVTSGAGASSAGPTITYTPIIVPQTYVTIPTTLTSQTLTVPVPAGYSGAVSLSVGSCLYSKAAVTSPGFTEVGVTVSNAAIVPLVTVSPSSATPSTSGASVTFTVAWAAAGSGACILTSSADSSVYGAVVAW